MINDYRSTFGFIDFKKFGITEIVGAGRTTGPHRGHDISSDRITIFINYQQIHSVKSKDEARKLLNQILIEMAPEARGTFDEMKDYLFETL